MCSCFVTDFDYFIDDDISVFARQQRQSFRIEWRRMTAKQMYRIRNREDLFKMSSVEFKFIGILFHIIEQNEIQFVSQ